MAIAKVLGVSDPNYKVKGKWSNALTKDALDHGNINSPHWYDALEEYIKEEWPNEKTED